MMVELQTIAICEALEGLPEYTWRKFCRRYSELFSTPYHLVLKMPMPFVITSVMEYNIDQMDDEKLEKFAYQLLDEDPEEEALLQKQIAIWEQEERDKIEARKNGKIPKRRKSRILSKNPMGKAKTPDLPEIKKNYDMGDPDSE